MLERRRIVALALTGTAEVLVTLVRAEGSSYRRPGARLLIGAAGAYAGTISGGCLETEVTRKAIWLTRGGPTVERYSTLFDDTADIPFGLGCGGTVDLLYERAGTLEAAALFRALESSLTGDSATVLTWLPRSNFPLRRAVIDPRGEVLFASAGLGSSEILAALAHPTETVYREDLRPPQRLVLFGAGDDARPVASVAALLGWTLCVADGRAQLARADRFPEASVVQVLASSDSLGMLRLTSGDAAVLMTHSYEQDRDILTALLREPAPPAYLGLLGARHRTALLVAEAAARVGQSVASACSRIHAPVGLDLGGDGPEAIALAIVAEVQAFCQGKLPASRRLTEADVARQLRQGDAACYLQTSCVPARER